MGSPVPPKPKRSVGERWAMVRENVRGGGDLQQAGGAAEEPELSAPSKAAFGGSARGKRASESRRASPAIRRASKGGVGKTGSAAAASSTSDIGGLLQEARAEAKEARAEHAAELKVG